MGRIKICAAEEQIGKLLSGAQEEFLRYCRLRNLSPRTIEFYREDMGYFLLVSLLWLKHYKKTYHGFCKLRMLCRRCGLPLL